MGASQQIVASIVIIGVIVTGFVTRTDDVHANADGVPSVHASTNHIIAAADTVAMEVLGGETIIFALPDSLSGEKVETWKLIRSPAYSKLASRSFVWKTRKSDRGVHVLTFEGTSTIIVDEFSVSRIETWTASIRVK